MISMRSRWLNGSATLAVVAVLSAVPALAQTASFGTFTLGADQTSVVVKGATGGAASLPAIVTNSDRNRNKCLGFGDPQPDHVMVLQKPFTSLKLKINNGKTDNTLVIVGPNNVVRCGDALLEDNDWQAGAYQIWVGSSTPGSRQDYRLSVKGN